MTRALLREPERMDAAAELLKALGHPLRLGIVTLLSERQEHVNAIAAELDAAPSVVSQQLRILRMAGLVAATRVDGQAVYRISDPRLFKLLECMESHR